jgi:D-alanyl-D-alanine carboxypeptidase
MIKGDFPVTKTTPLTQSIDALLSPVFASADPGAAVIVTQNGRVIFRKGYGLANIELKVPIRPEMVFRIGSVTKQFTTVAVLMLVQEGKIALDAEITDYLPDYPTHGEKITIEHLLTHTSGIKSYTDMPEWMPLWRKDLPLPELIGLFKDQPPEFRPGERWAYNNSAFVLLGAVIEKVSGQSYAQFLAERIFKPLGMDATRYDVTEQVVPGRVAGYNKGANGWENAAYLSMTHPHGAGALMSSVDDLARWDKALYTRKLVKPALLQKAWKPYILADGRSTQYGFGWGITTIGEQAFIAHGGGINGFICAGVRMPEKRIYVAILTNRTGMPDHLELLAFQIAFLTAGLPFPEIQPAEIAPEALAACQGVYQIDEKEDLVLEMSEGKWFAQRTGGGKDELVLLSECEFCYKDYQFARIVIQRGVDGKVSGLEVRGNFGPYEPARLTDKPLPSARAEINLPVAVLKRYEGAYELAPGMLLVISLKGERLVAQPTGQPEAELFAETETKFFLKVVDANLEFVLNAAGLAEAINFKQGSFQALAKRKP